ncbi:MAG TPA: TetR/AcrR family transcriptional regulator [bacterium (Candidatus Stahlbacteria)]|nr:TetR/AcrR family transcriptional regulator [Candidatus Stahlbacteria bacterium]
MRREDQILDAASKVFMEVGYSRATVEKIAKRAKVAKGTVYLYFKNKEDLFISLLARQMRHIVTIARKIENQDPMKRMAEFGKTVTILDPPIHQILSYGQIPISKTFVRRIKKEMNENFGMVVEIISEWIKEGIKKRIFVRVNPLNTAILFLALTRFIPVARFFSEVEIDVDEILRVFFDGIRRR